MIAAAYQRGGQNVTVRLADAMKNLGFEMATVSGITVALSDIVIPQGKGRDPGAKPRRKPARSGASARKASSPKSRKTWK